MTKQAIITGGASGIGLALGEALVTRGWRVVLDDIQHDKARAEAERLTRAGPGTATAAGADVRDLDALTAVVHQAHSDGGHLDLMVNNAGIGVGGEPDELLPVHWDTIIDTNLRGVIHGCHAAYPLMKRQGFGTILNTASMAGLGASSGFMAPYGTTKYAVVGLSVNLRAAGAQHGVRVSVLCPGWIDTPMLDSGMPEGLPDTPSMRGAPSIREFLRRTGQTAYPADRLAEDTLAALAKNRAIIVLPRSWHRRWLLLRTFPSIGIRVAEQATRSMRRELASATSRQETAAEPVPVE